MADISKITLPNGSTYLLKDAVARRKCSSKMLSSSGWYRVLNMNWRTEAQALGVGGFSIDFSITRWGSQNLAEQHKISLFSRYASLEFLDEISRSGEHLLVDGIRYCYKEKESYVDIHYNSANSNEVTVYSEINVYPDYMDSFSSSDLVSVSDTPFGETVFLSYAFSGDIPESGNGYIKNSDGTMIQWGSVSGISFSSQNMVSGTKTMSKPFSSTNYTVILSAVNTGVNAYLFRLGASPSTADTFNWVLGSGDSSNITINNRGFTYVAYGRWK